MTSYGERLKTLHTHLSWVRSVPFNFHLYVGDTEVLEQKLLDFFEETPNANLHIVKDIGPLTKSYYSLQEFPDDVIFLVDDDIYYSPHWIKFAVDSYIQHQSMFRSCVIGLIARKVLITPDNHLEIMQFGNDQNEFQKSLDYPTGHAEPLHPSYRNLILSGGPGSFLNIRQVHKDYFDVDKYQEMCKSHDEMWNWVQSVRLGLKHVSLHSALIAPGVIPELQGCALNKIYNNISHEREIFDKFIKEYPEVLKRIIVG
jgi:hypothetical protein